MQRYLIVAGIVLLCLGIGASLFFSYGSEGHYPDLPIAKPGQPAPAQVTYRVTAPLTGLPERARVFKFDKPEVTLAYARRVAAAFGFNGEPDVNPGETIGRFTFKKEAESLEIDSDGTIRYTQSIPRELEENPVGVPNDQRAISLAREFLQKRGYLGGAFHVTVTDHTTGDKLLGTERICGKNVWFYPRLDGRPVLGIGRLMVEVGPKEIVKHVMIVWWPATPEKEVTLRSVQEALEDVKTHRPDLVSSSIPPEAVSATIDKVLLAYWADPDVSYIQPVWVFAGEAKIEDGRKERFDAITPAIAGVRIYSP